MKTRYAVDGSVFEDYTTVLFDLDQTLWDCFDARGTSIPAFKMEPPFELLEEDLVSDVRKNICRLQPNFRDVLASLDAAGVNLGVVSRSAVRDLADEAQPSKMLLGKLDLLKYFTYIVVIKEGIDKGDYARPEGRTLFVDDQPDMLQAVNARGLVDVLSRRKFVGWETLFTKSKPERPRPATVQQFTNTPQPTTSALQFSNIRLATPETYTDKSDIDGGIGGGARNKADMWHMEDHLELDNGRDHVWGEPWEPMEQYFLSETEVTPMVNDKLRMQHPDKGGIAVSSLVFAAPKKPSAKPPVRPTVDNLEYLISDLAYKYVKAYSQRKDLDEDAVMAIVKPVIVNTLSTQYRIPQQTILMQDTIIEDEIYFAIQTWMPYAGYGGESSPYGEVDEFTYQGYSRPRWDSDTDWRSKYPAYKPPPPKAYDTEKLLSAVHDFLLSQFAHERFSVKHITDIVDTYMTSARAYPNVYVERAVKALVERYPQEFSMQGDVVYIGDPAQAPAGQAAPLRIDTESLKAITQAPIEDFAQYGQSVDTPDGMYVFKDNGSDILAVAHLDTRQDLTHFDVSQAEGTTVIRNAQLDDRLGAYIILDMLPKMGITTDVLLTEGEEVGRSTAQHFATNKQYKWIFSFDRRGMDTVLYHYHDPATEKLMTDNRFTVGRGAFSDISYLTHLGAKGFNFGTGYYDNHGVGSNAIESHVMHNVQLFKQFYEKYKNTALPHAKGAPGKPRPKWPPDEDERLASVSSTSASTSATRHASGRSFADQQVCERATEIAHKLRTVDSRMPSERLFTVVCAGLTTYYDVTHTDVSRLAWAIRRAIADSPKGEQYTDYMGTMDVSPKDPKTQNELEEPWSIRKDLERQYFELGLHGGPDRPETDRPLTPYASVEEPAVDTELHRPNTILVHEGVLQALTFAESIKSCMIVQHEAREDYQYVAPEHS